MRRDAKDVSSSDKRIKIVLIGFDSMKLKFMQKGYTKTVSLTVWVFALAAITGFSGLLIYMDQYEKGQLTESKNINIKQLLKNAEGIRIGGREPAGDGLKSAESKNSDQPEAAKPKFDFYSLLPEMEVIVPELDVKLRSKPKPKPKPEIAQKEAIASQGKDPGQAEPDATIATATDPVVRQLSKNHFFVQSGAFKDIKSADRQKASLALMGIQSAIFSVNLNKRGVWHRVRVGPFSDMEKITQVISVMKSHNINPIVVKVKS